MKQHITKKMWVELSVVGVIILVIIGAGVYYGGSSTGQAVSLGNAPLLVPANLTAEETLTFTALGEGTTETTFETNLQEYGDSQLFDITITSLGTQYVVSINEELDTLSEGETVTYYLSQDDALADVEVSLQSGRITVKNLHYVGPERSEISALRNGQPVLPITQVTAGTEFEMNISASSVGAPALLVTVDGIPVTLQNLVETDTTANATFTHTPAESGAVVVEVTGTVLGQATHKLYTLAVGDVVYGLVEENFPSMTYNIDGTVDITFAATEALQPFALPCAREVPNGLALAFGGQNIERVYKYDDVDQPGIWTQTLPKDFQRFEPFRGYFVKLASPEATTIQVLCDVESFEPLDVPIGGELGQISNGWTLFSIPGVVARPLTDFTSADDFILYECSQGYSCRLMENTESLNPGKPYWVYSDRLLNFRYNLQ